MLDTISGFKLDLSSQFTQHFQIGGSWQYNKVETGFSLNTALLADPMSQDSHFCAATYHDNGKMESRAMVNLPYSTNLSGEFMFQGPDTTRAYCALDVTKYFSHCSAGVKCGTGMRGFSYMQTLCKNCHAGFECNYMVPLVLREILLVQPRRLLLELRDEGGRGQALGVRHVHADQSGRACVAGIHVFGTGTSHNCW